MMTALENNKCGKLSSTTQSVPYQHEITSAQCC